MELNLVTLNDVARALGLSRIAVQKRIERGTLKPAGKVGNQYVFRTADMKSILSKYRRTTTKTA